MESQLLIRRGASSQWSTINPILDTGEWGLDTSTRTLKLGNGTAAWSSLPGLILGHLEGTTANVQSQLNDKVGQARTLTLNGTTNQIDVSGGTQNLSADRSWSLSLPQNIHTGASPRFQNMGLGINAPSQGLEIMGVSQGEYLRAGAGTISARSLTFSNFTNAGFGGVGHFINAPHPSGVVAIGANGTSTLSVYDGVLTHNAPNGTDNETSGLFLNGSNQVVRRTLGSMAFSNTVDFIQNQNASAQTANIWIDGFVRASDYYMGTTSVGTYNGTDYRISPSVGGNTVITRGSLYYDPPAGSTETSVLVVTPSLEIVKRTLGSMAFSGTGDFIQNQNASAQTANMWISGIVRSNDHIRITSGVPYLELVDTSSGAIHYVEGTDSGLVFWADVTNIASNSSIGFNIDGTVRATFTSQSLEITGTAQGEYFRAGAGTISERSIRFSSFTNSGLAGVGHLINAPHPNGVVSIGANGSYTLNVFDGVVTHNAPSGAGTETSGLFLNGSNQVVRRTLGAAAFLSSAVTSVGLTTSFSSVFSISGSPVTSNGNITIGLQNQAQNLVLASPGTGAGAPSFRFLIEADIPNLLTSKITGGVFPIARGGTGLSTLGSSGQLLRSNGSSLEYWTPNFLTNTVVTSINIYSPSSTSIPSESAVVNRAALRNTGTWAYNASGLNTLYGQFPYIDGNGLLKETSQLQYDKDGQGLISVNGGWLIGKQYLGRDYLDENTFGNLDTIVYSTGGPLKIFYLEFGTLSIAGATNQNIAAADGAHAVMYVCNSHASGFNLTVVHNSGSATTTNRFFLPGGTNITIQPGGSRAFIYVDSRWQLLA
jgi:hypothetical protein